MAVTEPGRLLLAFGATLLIFVTQASPAFAASENPAEELGPGTVYFDLSHDELLPLFTDSETIVVYGTKTLQGGCTFPSQLHGGPGEPAMGELSLAVNASRCRALFMRGHLAQLPGSVSARHEQLPAAPTDCRWAWNDIWQTDPVNITVTLTEAAINWCYDFQSVTSSTCFGDWSWYTLSGWYLIGGPFDGCSPVDQWNVDAYTYLYVGNDTFWCGQTAHTRTLYDQNQVRANYFGQFWDMSYYTTWGECSGLLTWHHTLNGA